MGKRAACSHFLILCLTAAAVAAAPVTTQTLVDEMVDLVRLGDFPVPAYQTVQFSSSDHRSQVPGGPDWFANSDGFGGEPIPNFEAVLDPPDEQGKGRYLICDVQGPGAIVRTWTAAISGTIRVYLDGDPQPLFDGPAQEFLQESYRRFADAAGLDVESLAATYRQRDACYFPIPFAQRCRIEWLGNVKEIHFYEVQVRRYAQDAQVVTFRPEDFQSFSATIQRVCRILADPQRQWPYRSDRAPNSSRFQCLRIVSWRSSAWRVLEPWSVCRSVCPPMTSTAHCVKVCCISSSTTTPRDRSNVPSVISLARVLESIRSIRCR